VADLLFSVICRFIIYPAEQQKKGKSKSEDANFVCIPQLLNRQKTRNAIEIEKCVSNG